MSKQPDWMSQPLVACIDGAMGGQWYTEAEWRERQQTAAYMAARGQRPTAILFYRSTGEQVEHPEHEGVFGAAWAQTEGEAPA